MFNFVVRCWLANYIYEKPEDEQWGKAYGRPARTLHSTIECKDLVDANETAKALSGVRETEVCVVILVAGKHEQPKRVIIPIAELDRVHRELYDHEDDFEPKALAAEAR